MKNIKSFQSKCALLAFGTLLLTAPAALAGGGPGGGGGGIGNLDQEDRTALIEFNGAVTTASTATNEKLTAARTALADAIFAAKLDEAKVKEASAAVAKLEEELNVIRAKEFDKSRAKLNKPEVVTALKTLTSRGTGAAMARGGRGNIEGGGAPASGGRRGNPAGAAQ